MIFISYSRKNMEAARAVRSVLQANGLSVWMDENSIVVGTDYADRIPAAIEACTAFVLVLSQESMMSAWVRKELDTALLMEKPILPIHIDKSNISRAYTFMLSGIQFVEASGNSADAYKRLVSRAKALEAEAEGGAADAPAGPSQKKGLLDLLGFGAKKKPAAVPESADLKSQLKPVDYSKEIEALCQRVAELDAIYDGMSPSTFGSQTSRFRERLARGEVLESIMPEAIATMWHAYGRASTSTLNAAIALFKGMAVDVDAGDPLDVPIAFAAYAYALEGKGVHAVFETEEAARRACRYFARPFERLGISTAVVGRKDSSDDKRAAYAADVTFGSYATFVLDYLSDNTVGSPVRRVQRGLAIALINDADRVLIDFASMPCTITTSKGDGIASCAACDFFRMYDLIGGISTTAEEAADDLRAVYRMPFFKAGGRQKPLGKNDDEVFITDEGRWKAVARRAGEKAREGHPVIIEISREFSADVERLMSLRRRVDFEIDDRVAVVDGADPKRDATVLSRAGERGSVTIIVDDAADGVPILPKNADLYAIATEHHMDSRHDRRFEDLIAANGPDAELRHMLSLDDHLVEATSSDFMTTIKQQSRKLGVGEDDPIAAPMLTRSIASGQKSVEKVERLALRRWIELESPINWQQQYIYELRNQCVDRIEMGELARGFFAQFAENVVRAACPEGEPRSRWNLGVLNAECAKLGSDAPIPFFSSAESRDHVLEMMRGWMDEALNRKAEELGLDQQYLDELLGRAMVMCIDREWPLHRKQLQMMMDRVKRPSLDNDAAWVHTIEQFKTEIGKPFAELQDRIYREYVSAVLGLSVKPRESQQGTVRTGSSDRVSSDNPYRGVRPNDLCPCGSGKKFKACHGRPKENA